MTSEERQFLIDIQDDLTLELNILRDDVLKRAGKILNRDVSVQSLHGLIGGKNNIYVDSVRTQFLDFKDFFSNWLQGLNDKFLEQTKKIKIDKNFNWNYRSSYRIVRLLKDDKIFQYTERFLERNFYKHVDQRVRFKPDENLWAIWFGYKLTYGLLIAPKKILNEWVIDKSEIRRATYNYWTVGHVMQTGLIDPAIGESINFNDFDAFCKFYLSILKRLSNSIYEQAVYDKYVSYLKSSANPLDEPFLIPEFRYAGLKKDHEHRLDFTILNSHSVDFVGYEISPASSHMNVKKLKQKQCEVNMELKEKWEKEMLKRNKYFYTFGITTITFTDQKLTDIDACFKEIANILSKRPKNKTSICQQKQRLNNF